MRLLATVLTLAGSWVMPSLAIAATTTYTGAWSGGTIGVGDTVVLDNGASVTGNVVANGTLQFNQTTALTVGGTVSGTGALSLTNTGTLALTGLTSGTARFDLAITASSGRLMIGSSGTNHLVVGSSGTGSLTVAGGWISSGTGFLGLSAGSVGTATVSSGSWTNARFLYVGYSGTGRLDVPGGRVENTNGVVGFAGGVGTVTVSGGTWKNASLSIGGYTGGASSGTGSLTVSGGQVTNSTGYIGTNAGSVGTATVTGGTWTNSAALYVGSSGSGTLLVSGGMVSNATGALGHAGVIGHAAGSFGSATVTGGTWANTGSLVVGGSGSGTLTVSGSGGTGGTVIVSGTLSRGAQGTINLASGGTLRIGSGSATGVLATDLVNDGVLVFNRTGSGTVSNAISGTGALAVMGGGTLSFTGSNSYSGPTSVDAGAVLVAGSLGATPLAVRAGALLGGSGTIGGQVTVFAGGTLAPGPGVESLGAGALALLDGSLLAYDVDSSGTSADLVNVAGNIGLSGTVALLLTDVATNPTTFADGTRFSLLAYTGTWNGGLFTLGGVTLGDGGMFTFAERSWMIDYDAALGGSNFSGEYLPGSRFVNVTVVPEPSAWVLVAAGLASACHARRRRRPHAVAPRAVRGFTIVEILVTVAIVGGLAALLLPAVQSVRESSRRTQCLNNLRQIGIGFHNYHAVRDCFPTAVSGSGARHYWTAQILPYLDENPLAEIYDYAVACNDIRNRDAVQIPLAFMCCPSTPAGPRRDVKFIKTGSPIWPAAAADYAGSAGPSSTLWSAPAVVAAPKPAVIDGFFTGTINPGARGRRIRDLTDGSSKSIAVFECAGRPQVWTFGEMVPDSGLATSPASRYVSLCGWADANQFVARSFRLDPTQADPVARCRSPGPQVVNGSNNFGIYAAHPTGADVLFADGSSGFLDQSIAADVVAAMLTIQGRDDAGGR